MITKHFVSSKINMYITDDCCIFNYTHLYLCMLLFCSVIRAEKYVRDNIRGSINASDHTRHLISRSTQRKLIKEQHVSAWVAGLADGKLDWMPTVYVVDIWFRLK